ncbi:hypothetical protein [Cellulosimicrobium sp. Marseille-Q4280]|uniref:hypothetical protein n=1 Tax=Cellulosimicrobium sp. Marseille-Q4280 TaxID=2937992 RepID=UPI00203C494E|nr:hypothetical protein [Cellulosimicrobium sp. Marseille-Q4280]
MRLRDAALTVADAGGPLPITHTDGAPVAEADKRGLRMVRLARDLMLQLRRAGVVGTARVFAIDETSRRGTRSIVLAVAPAGAPTNFQIVAADGMTRRGSLHSVTGDPYGYLAVPGGRWAEISLNHGPERLNLELAESLAGTLAGAVWDDVVGTKGGRGAIRLRKAWAQEGVVVLMLDGSVGRTRVAIAPGGRVTSIQSIDDSGALVRAGGAYQDFLAHQLADALGDIDVLGRFRDALVQSVHAHLPTLPKDVRGFEVH